MINLPDKFLHLIKIQKNATFKFKFTANNVPIFTKFSKCTDSKKLIIFFHGSVNHARRSLPIFVSPPSILSKANILSISDPSIRDRNINISWYAGDYLCNSLKYIPDIIQKFCDILKIERKIYAGSSGGGFAALNFAKNENNSIAVVNCPQTIISSYSNGIAANAYMKYAWPKLKSIESLHQVTRDNLCDYFRDGFKCKIVYLQAIGDKNHYLNHALPFISSCSNSNDKNKIIFFPNLLSSHSTVPDFNLAIRFALNTNLNSKPDWLDEFVNFMENNKRQKIEKNSLNKENENENEYEIQSRLESFIERNL